MEPEPRTVVAVLPASAMLERPRLFRALEAALPVRFIAGTGATAEIEAAIVIAPDPGAPLSPECSSLDAPMLVVGGRAGVERPIEDVRLAATDGVDTRLRGVVLRDRPVGSSLVGLGEVLAEGVSGPMWTRSVGEVPIHRVRAVLPELDPDQVLYVLLSQRAIASVALIQFLRGVSDADNRRRPPPLRAALVFDDPNLRWRSYGFIHYGRLLRHADRHGYHVAMAMIPLDATRPHGATVSLFERRPDRLSLVFHGNDHIKEELLTSRNVASAVAMAAQAVRRVERFERGSGLRVDRVMMPPHGLCSTHMSHALAAVGFDALFAIHPLPWTEERPKSPLLAAWRPSEFVRGCAVIPRMAITSTMADIALRAFLDHPIVVYGHHDDLADGLEPLADVADRVNQLGDVRWTSVGEIALTNVVSRLSGDLMVIRPYARRVRVTVPPEARALVVERPEGTEGDLELTGWSLGSGVVLPFDSVVELPGGRLHEVRLRGAVEVDPREVAAPAWRLWPKLRRVAAEGRDRVLPLRAAVAG